MNKTAKRILFTLSLTIAFCFGITSLVQAGANDHVTEGWAKNNLINKQKAAKIPIWQITQDGTAKAVNWVNHAPNPRFAVYDPGTPGDETDDLVLDRETRLVWERTPDTELSIWRHSAQGHCYDLQKANRKGFRSPTIEELGSLVDYNNTNPALPTGHPFNVTPAGRYWSRTTVSDPISHRGTHAWYLELSDGELYLNDKEEPINFASGWCVRGGYGLDGW